MKVSLFDYILKYTGHLRVSTFPDHFPVMIVKKSKRNGKRFYYTFLKKLSAKIKNRMTMRRIYNGADERNRTAVSTLARWRSTIELHLHHMAVTTGLEPVTSSVTGRHSNQLN